MVSVFRVQKNKIFSVGTEIVQKGELQALLELTTLNFLPNIKSQRRQENTLDQIGNSRPISAAVLFVINSEFIVTYTYPPYLDTNYPHFLNITTLHSSMNTINTKSFPHLLDIHPLKFS